MAELLKREGNQVEFKVTVPAAQVNTVYNGIVSSLIQQVKVPGFRPGKAPKSVVIKRVGQDYLDDEVRERLLQPSLNDAAGELKLFLIDVKIVDETLKEGTDYVYTVQGETYPEVTLPDWKGFNLEAKTPEITDEVVESTLKELAERNAVFTIVERPATEADMVMVEEQNDEKSSYPVYLDKAEGYIRDALVGKSAGDVVEINIPEIDHGDHKHDAETLSVKVLEVKNKDLPEIDDELAKSFKFDSIDALRTSLKKDLENRAKQEGEATQRDEFINKLADGLEADIPQTLIDRRKEAMLEEIRIDLKRQGVDFAEYESIMRQEGKFDEFLGSLDQNALLRVRRDLATEKLAEDLNTQLTESEWQTRVLAFARSNRTTVQELQKALGANGMSNLRATVLRDKAVQEALDTFNPKTEEEVAPAEEKTEDTTSDKAE